MGVSRRSFLRAAAAGLGIPALSSRRLPQAPAAVPDDLSYLTIAEASALISSRRLSPLELTRHALARIDELEPRVGAFVTVLHDRALAAAGAAEKEIMGGSYRGPLHGIPVGLKDNQYTLGVRTTAASPVLADFVPSFDATVARRLQAAGAVIVGKTNLPEFSFGGHTPGTHNPWDLSRTAGGSSGGSGAALAAGMVMGATGGDTSGSIRNPATTNGVVGLKPTFGRVSLYGIVPIAWSLDHVGPMTRTVRDNAILLNALAGHDPLDDRTVDAPVPDYEKALGESVRGYRIGLPESRWFDGFHPDVMKAFEQALAVFERLGCRVREIRLPAATQVISEVQRIVRIAEAAAYHERFLLEQPGRYGPSNVRRDVEAGSLITAAQYLRAQRIRKVFVKEMGALFEGLDIFMTPGKPEPAGERVNVRQNFRSLFNLLGFPALAIPAGFSESPPGLPVGLQLSAAPFREETIYRAAFAYESETRWYERRPDI